ncbi:MAG: GNAT family N-acetyltransferase [Cytophagaceae bacterium]
MNFNIKHDSKYNKFFTEVAGKESNLSYEKITDNIWDYKLMFVPKNLRGQGIAGRVVDFALNFARKNNIKIKASCSFVQGFIENHPEFRDVLIDKTSPIQA